MDYAGLLELVKERRTRREFKTDPIPDEYVDQIIEVARWAPAGFNTQPWEFVVIKKPELREKIVKMVDEYRGSDFFEFETTREPETGAPWQPDPLGEQREFALDNAPVFILLFGDTRVQRGLPMAVRWNYQKCETIWHASMANAFLYMLLAANTLGLACCWVSAVQIPLLHCKIKHLLGIPEVYELHDMMAVGYPAGKVVKKLMRPREEMVHYDEFKKGELRTDEQVYDWIRKTRTWVLSEFKRGKKD